MGSFGLRPQPKLLKSMTISDMFVGEELESIDFFKKLDGLIPGRVFESDAGLQMVFSSLKKPAALFFFVS